MVTVGGCALARKLRKRNIFLASYLYDIMAEVEHYYIFTVGWILAMHPGYIPTDFYSGRGGGGETGVMFLSKKYQRCPKISEDVAINSQSQSQDFAMCNFFLLYQRIQESAPSSYDPFLFAFSSVTYLLGLGQVAQFFS